MGGSQSAPVGGGGVGEAMECPCANGTLCKGSRVRTQWTRAEGGNDHWYNGTITKVFANRHASIRYDDGDVWTGDTMDIFLLQPNANKGGLSQQPAPGMMVMTATVPPGAMAGTPIPVMMPNGQPYHVAVPAGLMPGQTFQFQAPMQQGAMQQGPPVAQAVPVQGPPVVVYGQPVEAQPVAGQPTKF